MSDNDRPPAEGDRPRALSPLGRPVRHFQKTLGAGVLILLPIGITVLVLKFFFDLLDSILRPLTNQLPGPEVTGLGLAALLLLVYVVGLVAAFVLGRRVIELGHRILEVIPLVRGIYSTTRVAVRMLSANNDSNYTGVVLVDFPRTGIKSIGLITSHVTTPEGEELLSIYIPTTPIPSSGFLIYARTSEVTLTDMSVDEAMRIVISGGVLSTRVFERMEDTSQADPAREQ